MSAIPVVLLFAISMAANLISGLYRKYFSDKTIDNNFWSYFFIMITSFACTAVFIVWGGLGDVSWTTFLFGAGYGIIMSLELYTMMIAITIGSFSISTLIISLGALLPAVSGAIFWNEKLSVINIIGLVAMVVAIVLSVGKDTEKKKANIKWLLAVFACFIFAFGVGMIQKIHQSGVHRAELNCFLISAFAVSTIFMLVLCIISAIQNSKKSGASFGKMLGTLLSNPPFAKYNYIIVFVVGILMAANNKFNLYLSGVVDSAVFFTVINGGAMVLTAISSVILFKEKLTLKMLISIIIGTAAMVMVCI